MVLQTSSKASWQAPVRVDPGSPLHHRSSLGSLECQDICKRKVRPASTSRRDLPITHSLILSRKDLASTVNSSLVRDAADKC